MLDSTRRLRVLVVDDNRDAADSLALLVQSEGHEVYVAYDAVTGLELAWELLPQVVLHDIRMPGMEGYEAAQRMRKTAELDPAMLVAVTGCADARFAERAQAAGFDRHYLKPLSYRDLRDVLGSVRPPL